MTPSARRQDARLAREGESFFLLPHSNGSKSSTMYVYKGGEIIMEPSCAMPEDAQAGKCVGEELVDLQDGRSGVIRSNRDLSENSGYT